MTFYKTHDLFSLLLSVCCLLIANLVVSKEMLKEQFSLMLMQGKYFQHCYTMQALRGFAINPFPRAHNK